jgi:4,5-DOPA dioxygenase extradiol
MDRKTFLKIISLSSILIPNMDLKALNKITSSFALTETMPLFFVGHGNPMNAIEENEFTKGWRSAANSSPKPNAILCISAHWETKGTYVTAMEKPRTIHDFGGFPKELFDVEYPAPGSPELAELAKNEIKSTDVGLDYNWGLDHGTWSVIKHFYPKADIPIIQLSLDYTKSAQYHYELASEMKNLREKGVMIVSSGNMVHNLRMVDWRNPNGGFDWANEANDGMKKLIFSENIAKLTDITSQGESFKLSVPTPEHYNPLMYILGLKEKDEEISFFNDKTVMGSLSMTSIKIG